MSGEHPEQRVTLVAGGSRGIGRAVALGFAQAGNVIIVNYLQNDAAAQETQQLIEASGAVCHLVRANLAFPSEIDMLFDQVRSAVDHLDVFVHCAAMGAFKPLVRIKPNQWDLSMAVNARSSLLCVQKCLPLMKQGRIVAISSLGSHRAVPNYGAIGASKAALEAVIRQLAAELAPRGIQINGISGGFVETEATRNFPDYDNLVTEIIRRTPAGRLGRPEDIAEVVKFLVSPESAWINGQVIIADGGFSLT
jgi:enoyl-[acyl-carrier protein] reductase III